MERYDRALDLVCEVVPVCDVCHIYDNSKDSPYRIFKKRKSEYFYCTLSGLWLKEDITALTGVEKPKQKALNTKRIWEYAD